MKRIVFVGNCQALALSNAYAAWIAPRRNEVVEFIKSYQEGDEQAIQTLQNADLVVHQLWASEQTLDVARLKVSAPMIPFPLVQGAFLWPFRLGAHPLDSTIPEGHIAMFTGEFGDRYLDRAIRADEDPESVLAAYADLDVLGEVRIDRRYDMAKRQQEERDKRCDIPSWQEISSHLSSEPLFLAAVHPSLRLFSFLVTRLFHIMGASKAHIEDALRHYRTTPFSPLEVPIHPKIAQYFRMHFLENYAFNCHFGERLKWRDYCQRYLSHDWNKPLQEALARWRRLATDPDLRGLLRDLELATSRYDSAEGHFAISDVRLRLGDVGGALEALQKAVHGRPEMVGWTTRLADLLIRLGRHQEAEAISRRVVADQPAFFLGARLTLIEALARQGRNDEALREAQEALRFVPEHVHLRSRVDNLKSLQGRPEAR